MAEPTRFTSVEVKEDLKAGSFETKGIGTGSLNVGVLALTKSDSYALSAVEKANAVFAITLSAAPKTVTLGLPVGQFAIVKNAGSTNAFTLKNIAGDTGTSLATGKSVLIVASATKDKSLVIALD